MKFICCFLLFIICFSCEPKQEKLPILGNHSPNETKDTVYHQIPDFRFVNQDSEVVTNETFKDKIYVADFFFTSCPTICPVMKTQMLRVYEKYKDNDNVSFLSHSIDPEYDTVALLKKYSQRLGVEKPGKWHFVTGDMDQIHEIAQSYLSVGQTDSTAPGGYLHSGAFILIDQKRHIRGVYNGTDKEKVDQLIRDIKILLEEK
jgi:protein SCO1